MPPHSGHARLIEIARERSQHLTILVCSLENEPIPGRLRYEWMKEMYPDVSVVWVTDENPSYPDEHPDFWDIWRKTILSNAPEPDAVFTGESYGDRLAAVLGAVHICVNREDCPGDISGSEIREDPYKHWDHLPPRVRAYYAKRVAIVGAESTGKTTLAKALAERFNTVWAPEYAVEYLKNGNQDCKSIQDIENIARGQISLEEEMAAKANKIVFCDTDTMTTVVWSSHFFGECPQWILDESFARKYDLTLLTNIDIPWICSPWRDCPDKRAEFHDWFKRELELRRRPYIEISGSSPEDRLSLAAVYISRLLGQEVSNEAFHEAWFQQYRHWAEHAEPLVREALDGERHVAPESPFVEAWLSYSLYSSEGELSLQELLEAADSVNKLIPTPDEISWAFLQLRKRGWLTENLGRYGLTIEARRIIRTIADDGDVLDEMERLRKWILAQPA